MIEAPSTVEFNSGELVIQHLKNTLMSNFSEKVTKTSIRNEIRYKVVSEFKRALVAEDPDTYENERPETTKRVNTLWDNHKINVLHAQQELMKVITNEMKSSIVSVCGLDDPSELHNFDYYELLKMIRSTYEGTSIANKAMASANIINKLANLSTTGTKIADMSTVLNDLHREVKPVLHNAIKVKVPDATVEFADPSVKKRMYEIQARTPEVANLQKVKVKLTYAVPLDWVRISRSDREVSQPTGVTTRNNSSSNDANESEAYDYKIEFEKRRGFELEISDECLIGLLHNANRRNKAMEEPIQDMDRMLIQGLNPLSSLSEYIEQLKRQAVSNNKRESKDREVHVTEKEEEEPETKRRRSQKVKTRKPVLPNDLKIVPRPSAKSWISSHGTDVVVIPRGTEVDCKRCREQGKEDSKVRHPSLACFFDEHGPNYKPEFIPKPARV